MPLTPARVLRTFRYAVSFDGVDDYVIVPHSESIMPTQLSVEAWFSLSNFSTYYMRILEKGGSGIGNGYGLELNPMGTKRIRFVIWNSVTGGGIIDSNTIIELNKWLHVIGTLDSDGMRLYVNGVLETSQSNVTIGSTTHDLYIGKWAAGFGNFLNGSIYLIRIYNRALSPSEVEHNYENPDDPVTDGLVLSFYVHPDNIKDIDNDGILEWVDLSGHGNHGKLYGAWLVKLVKEPARVFSPARLLAPAR